MHNTYQGRRTNSSRGVRDCLEQRQSVTSSAAAGRTIVGGRSQSTHELGGRSSGGHGATLGRPPRGETRQELLRQVPDGRWNKLPASADALPGARIPLLGQDPGGYRPPVSADNAPRSRAQAGGRRRGSGEGLLGTLGATIQRSISCETGVEQRQAPVSHTLQGGMLSRAMPPHIHLPGEPLSRARSDDPSSRMQAGAAQSRCNRTVSLVSQFAEANSEFREYMEDRIVALDPFMPGEFGNDQWAFFAIYDGHGGTQASDHCEAQLHEVLISEIRAVLREQRKGASLGDQAVSDALTRVFHRVDEQLKTMGSFNLGTTATVALVQRSAGGLKTHVANVGDSRAIAIGRKGFCRLSQDDRATDPSEVLRVQQAGGFVSRGRVAGVLAVSRALGDHALKRSGVSWRPHVSVRESDTDIALVIASDGLWDTLEDVEVTATVNQSRKEGTMEHVAQRLVQDAQRRGSSDNITCIVALF